MIPPAWRSASFWKVILLFSFLNTVPHAEVSSVQAPFKSAACVEADCATRSINRTRGLKFFMRLSDSTLNLLPNPFDQAGTSPHWSLRWGTGGAPRRGLCIVSSCDELAALCLIEINKLCVHGVAFAQFTATSC